jgi:hypothetical protein
MPSLVKSTTPSLIPPTSTETPTAGYVKKVVPPSPMPRLTVTQNRRRIFSCSISDDKLTMPIPKALTSSSSFALRIFAKTVGDMRGEGKHQQRPSVNSVSESFFHPLAGVSSTEKVAVLHPSIAERKTQNPS